MRAGAGILLPALLRGERAAVHSRALGPRRSCCRSVAARCSARLRLALVTSQLTKYEKNARVQKADVKNKHRHNSSVYIMALCSSRPFYTLLIYRLLILLAAMVLV